MKHLLVLLATLLLATSASAESWSFGCSFAADNLTSNRPSDFKISGNNVGCYRFTIADSTSTSDLIVVEGESALWCFDPDNTDAAVDTATVTIHECLAGGAAGGTGSVNTCIDLGGANGNATLTGAEGTASAQNACVRTGPGVYFVRVTVASAKTAPDFSQVSVRGETSK